MTTRRNSLNPLKWTYDLLTNPKTHKSIAYLLLAMPLGIAYFVMLVTGFALGGGLLAIGVGILVWALLIGMTRLVGNAEASLARNLLDADIPQSTDTMFVNEGSLLGSARATLLDTKTWRSILFMALKFPLGIVTFVLTIISFAIPAALLSAPFTYQFAATNINGTVIDTFPEALAAFGMGIIALPIALFVLTTLATGWRALSEYALQPSTRHYKQKRKQKNVSSHSAYDVAARVERELDRRTRDYNAAADGELIYESEYRAEKAYSNLSG